MRQNQKDSVKKNDNFNKFKEERKKKPHTAATLRRSSTGRVGLKFIPTDAAAKLGKRHQLRSLMRASVVLKQRGGVYSVCAAGGRG